MLKKCENASGKRRGLRGVVVNAEARREVDGVQGRLGCAQVTPTEGGGGGRAPVFGLVLGCIEANIC